MSHTRVSICEKISELQWVFYDKTRTVSIYICVGGTCVSFFSCTFCSLFDSVTTTAVELLSYMYIQMVEPENFNICGVCSVKVPAVYKGCA